MRKRVSIIAIALVLVLVLGLLSACGATKYNVNIGEIANGSISVDKSSAEAGEQVTLTVTPDAGYKLSFVKVDGEALVVTDGTAVFEMPEHDVNIEAAFEKLAYTVTLPESIEHGSISASAAGGNAGDTITLTVEPEYGYKLASLKANDEVIESVEGVYSFQIPQANVVISASFELVEGAVTTDAPEGGVSLSAQAYAGKTAKGKFFVSYEESGIKLVAYVEDSVVYPTDGIAAYIGANQASNGSIGANNKGIVAAINGIKLVVAQNGEYVDQEAELNASIVPWADAKGVKGYVANISVSYEELGGTKEQIEGNITLLLTLSNADKNIAPSVSIYGNGEINNADTYPILNADGSFSNNYYKYGAGQLGQGDSSIETGRYWDLSKDYAKDSENYADRVAILDGHDAADNNLVLYRVSGKTLYAKATIELTGIANTSERYGKFGLMLFNGSSQEGVFFYVDAFVGDEGDVVIDNVNGTALGYNDGHNGWGDSWMTIGGTSGSFDLETKKIDLGLMAYNGKVYMFHGDKLVGSVAYDVKDEAVIGFKSFGYKLAVTNYSITDEITNDELVDLGVKLADAELDGIADEEIWSEEVLNNTYSFGKRENEGSYFDLAAVKGSDGVYFLTNIYHKQSLSEVAQEDGSGWWHWLNLEFRFGNDGGSQRVIYFEKGNLKSFGGIIVDKFITVPATEENSFNKTTVEFYAPYSVFPGYSKDNEEIGFKVLGWVAEKGWNAADVYAYITENGLIVKRSISVNSSIDISVKSEAVRGEEIKFSIPVEDGVEVGMVLVNGEELKANDDGIYSFIMPDKNVEINIVFDKEDLDVLFLGDSYMDFWNSFGFEYHTAAIESKANIGVGGTQIGYWTERSNLLSLMYNPSKLVFHIGVNDIDDGNTTAEVAFERFKNMISAYQKAFPDAEIYWVSLIHNTMFAHKCGEYDKMNNLVKEYVKDMDKVSYIDVTNVGVDAEGNTRVNMFYDGLHMSQEYGYPIWGKQILQAIGYEARIEGTELGDIDGSYAYSSGWSFSEDGSIAYNTVGGEQAIYAKDMAYASNFIFSADIKSPSKIGTDAYTKVGLLLRNDSQSIFAFFDTPDNNDGKSCNIVFRKIVKSNGFFIAGDWSWDALGYGSVAKNTLFNDFVNIKVAKIGSQIYMIVDGMVVSNAPFMTSEGESFVAGVLGFNRNIEVKNAQVVNGTKEEVLAELGWAGSDAKLDGIADDAIWTEEVLGNTHTFNDSQNASYESKFDLAAVKGTDGVYFLATITHKQSLEAFAQGNGTAWWHWLNIEFRFGNDESSQRAIYFEKGVVKGLGGIFVGDYVTVAPAEEGGFNKTTVEFYVPYEFFHGCSAENAEIRVKLGGWVVENGYKDLSSEPTVSSHGLRYAHNVSVSGDVELKVPTIARKGDVIRFSIELEDGFEIESVLVNSSAIESVEGVYSFTMPDKDVTIEVKFASRRSVDLSAVDGIITVSNSNPEVGEIVEFTVVAPWSIQKLTVNEVELEAVDGKYSFTVGDDDLVIDGKFIVVTDGITIDGELEAAAYGESLGFKVEGNRDVEIYGKKTQHGIVLYLIAHTNGNVVDASDWSKNHNFEFYLNNGIQRYVNSKDQSNGVTAFARSATLLESGEHQGQYEHRYEVFVAGEFDENVRLNYAFKAPGEDARYEGLSAPFWDRSDWWCPIIGGADVAKITGYGQPQGRPNNLFIGENGLVSTHPVAANATIDADFTEYADKPSVTRGNENAKFTFSGYTANDGYYLAITILQVNRAEATPEWHLNDNLEMRLFGTGTGSNIGFSIFDNFICANGAVSQYAMKRTELNDDSGYNYKTEVELFIAESNPSPVAYIMVGCNGNGFVGWQSLIWDGADRLKLDANGATFVQENYYDHARNADGVIVDGKLDEDFWSGVSAYNNSNCASSYPSVYGLVQAKKGHAGAYVAVTMYHNKPSTELLRTDGNGTDWYQYLNIEFRFIKDGSWDASDQRAASVTGTSINCASAFVTGENTDESVSGYRYKTVFEVFVPYEWENGFAIHSDMPLWISCVAEDGWKWLLEFNQDQNAPQTLTDNGFVRK